MRPEIELLMRGLSRELLKPIILNLLSYKPMHGYELMKRIEEKTGHRFSPGIIYPILRQMERDLYIRGREETSGGRRLRVYEITEKGRDFLEEFRKRFRSLVLRILDVEHLDRQ